jgi:hypothetical protein
MSTRPPLPRIASLREKVEFVEKHRKRLAKDAEKARSLAVKRLREAIAAVERACEEAVNALHTERWALQFPGEDANPSSLRVALMKGGRLSKAVPDVRTLTVASSVLPWLRDDASWLDAVLAGEQEERELDPTRKRSGRTPTKDGRQSHSQTSGLLRVSSLAPSGKRNGSTERRRNRCRSMLT